MLTDVPEGTPPVAAPAIASTTLFVIVVLVLFRVSGVWRLWVLLIGLVAGCIAASFFGLYDVQSVIDASWIGIPKGGGWPGFDPRLWPCFLVAPARLHFCDNGRGYRNNRRCHRHSKGLLARKPCAGLSRCARRGHRRWPGQPAVWPRGHCAQHHLLVRRCHHRTHRRCYARRGVCASARSLWRRPFCPKWPP